MATYVTADLCLKTACPVCSRAIETKLKNINTVIKCEGCGE